MYNFETLTTLAFFLVKVFEQLPYSLEIKPPSIKAPPLLFAKICCGGIFISNLSPLDHKLSSLPF